ncbi:MAG TPA: hypothetical protein VHV82_10630, partial [Sporichthyaceae bacterium]|nr:hypothetical protein [Sporichthyaceae bacterium]
SPPDTLNGVDDHDNVGLHHLAGRDRAAAPRSGALIYLGGNFGSCSGAERLSGSDWSVTRGLQMTGGTIVLGL